MNLRIGTTEQNSQHYYKKFYLEKNKGKNLLLHVRKENRSSKLLIFACERKIILLFFRKHPFIKDSSLRCKKIAT